MSCFKNYNPDKIKFDQSCVPCTVALEIFDDFDDKVHAFDPLSDENVDRHAQIWSIKIRGESNPCITVEYENLWNLRTLSARAELLIHMTGTFRCCSPLLQPLQSTLFHFVVLRIILLLPFLFQSFRSCTLHFQFCRCPLLQLFPRFVSYLRLTKFLWPPKTFFAVSLYVAKTISWSSSRSSIYVYLLFTYRYSY